MKRKAFIFKITAIAILLSGLIYGGIKGTQFWKTHRQKDQHILIKALVQTGPQKEALKTEYLCELMGLSCDKPIQTSAFDTQKAREQILTSPVIKNAQVRIIRPGILYIDYTIRQPLCYFYDFKNVALDQEGYPFPLQPFYSPKKLPQIFLGSEKDIQWNTPVTGKKIDLAFEILKIINGPIIRDIFNVERIDVSNAFSKRLGTREVVITTQDEIYITGKNTSQKHIFTRFLRLSTKTYAQELSNFLKLRENLLKQEKEQIQVIAKDPIVMHKEKILDFRIPQLAFIEEVNSK